MFAALNQTAFDSAGALVELNLGVLKASLAESAEFNKQLFSAKDPQELFSLAATRAEPSGERLFSYGQRAATVAFAAQAEIGKAVQATVKETQHNVMALVDEVLKKAPAGAAPAVTLVKSAIGNAAAGMELLSKGTQQAFGAVNGHQPAAAAKPASKAA